MYQPIEDFRQNNKDLAYFCAYIQQWIEYIEFKLPHQDYKNETLDSIQEQVFSHPTNFIHSCIDISLPIFHTHFNQQSEIFIFGSYADYLMIEVSMQNLIPETMPIYALQFVLSAYIMGYKSIVIAVSYNTNILQNNNSYLSWQNQYKQILQSCNIAKYHCIHKHTRFIHTITNYFSKSQDSVLDCITLQLDSNIDIESLEMMRLYGLLSGVHDILCSRNGSLEGKFCTLTGSNLRSIYLAQGIQKLKGRVLTLSDDKGFIYDERGLDITLIKEILEKPKNFALHYESWLEIYANTRKCEFISNKESFWQIPAFICLINDPIHQPSFKHITALLRNGCKCVIENMPLTNFQANRALLDSKISYIPFMLLNSICYHDINPPITLNDLSNTISKFNNEIFTQSQIMRQPIDIPLGIFLQALRQFHFHKIEFNARESF